VAALPHIFSITIGVVFPNLAQETSSMNPAKLNHLVQAQRTIVEKFHLYGVTYNDALDAIKKQRDYELHEAQGHRDNDLAALQAQHDRDKNVSQAAFDRDKSKADSRRDSDIRTSEATLANEKQQLNEARNRGNGDIDGAKRRVDDAFNRAQSAIRVSTRPQWGATVGGGLFNPLPANGSQITGDVQHLLSRTDDDANAIRDYIAKNPSNGAGAFTVGALFIVAAFILFANPGGAAVGAIALICGGLVITYGIYTNGTGTRMQARYSELQANAAIIERWHKDALAQINASYAYQVQQSENANQARIAQFHATHLAQMQGITQQFQGEVAAIEARFQQESSVITARFQQESQAIAAKFQQKVQEAGDQFQQNLSTLGPMKQTYLQQCAIMGAAWNDPIWQQWTPHDDSATWQRWAGNDALTATRVGTLMSHVASGGYSEADLSLPVFVPIPSSNVMIKTNGAGNARAMQAVQALIMRLLVTQRPRRLMLTMFDPVGLGQNVANFMELREYDPELISYQAWSDPDDIKKQLYDLTAHMERMFQDNLRGKQTFEEYNAQQGDMGEAYRILVVFDFPTKFFDEALGRLESVMTEGPKAGVCTILVRDTTKPLPPGVTMDKMEQSCATIFDYSGQRFVWTKSDNRDALYQNDQLEFDAPPDQATTAHYLKAIGEAAKAYRINVPFSRIVEPAAEWWQGSTLKGIKVPIGLAGAQRKQIVELVSDGSNVHALVGGLTGSGKTITLHDLILNASLIYSPRELEMYLIDLNQVGFAPYRTHKLPHARVISINSGREFGLSVLQALVGEMQRRENLFIGLEAKAETEDALEEQAEQADLFAPVPDLEKDTQRETYSNIEEYRSKNPTRTLPRIMLIVDEFQEFFREKDKIAEQATMLLDMLAKLGRKFGIHVILATQTFMGEFAAAKSTLNQMTVRIAMRSAEDDSKFLLLDDVAAARIPLSRKGQGFYNPEGGQRGSSTQFQSANLLPDELDRYLVDLTAMAQQHPEQVPNVLRIIFDGNAEADIRENLQLARMLAESTWPATPPTDAIAFLGEPLAIGRSTKATFAPERGSNLLVVSDREEQGLNVLVTTVLSLCCQYAPTQLRITILDFTRVGAPTALALQNLKNELSRFDITIARREDAIAPLYAEFLSRSRDVAPTPADVRHFLFVFGLQNASDLQDNSYAYGNRAGDGSLPIGAQFAALLKGPEVNMFTFVYGDTAANVQTMFRNNELATFRQRVVFPQPTPNDSSILVNDISAARGRLGDRRAIFHHRGQNDEFRPYSRASLQQWLAQALEALNRKG
jgi:S-DNA-T family DNA segregation ATPase FtsK/SpoIIIE